MRRFATTTTLQPKTSSSSMATSSIQLHLSKCVLKTQDETKNCAHRSYERNECERNAEKAHYIIIMIVLWQRAQ